MSVIPDLKEIRRRRKRAGLSQAELSSMVGISQSHLAKIEQKKVDPGYGLVSRLFDALERAKKDECWQYMSTDVMTARKGENVAEVASRMKENGYSQVPVFDGGIPIGMLTERRIIELDKPYQTLRVEQAMEDHVIVPKETSYETVASMMKEFQAILVQEGGRIVGIITATDLIGHNPKPVRQRNDADMSTRA